MNNPYQTWEGVPAAEAPPGMNEANAPELLRQAAEQN